MGSKLGRQVALGTVLLLAGGLGYTVRGQTDKSPHALVFCIDNRCEEGARFRTDAAWARRPPNRRAEPRAIL